MRFDAFHIYIYMILCVHPPFKYLGGNLIFEKIYSLHQIDAKAVSSNLKVRRNQILQQIRIIRIRSPSVPGGSECIAEFL